MSLSTQSAPMEDSFPDNNETDVSRYKIRTNVKHSS